MPELPEVEHVVRWLSPWLVGRTVTGLAPLTRGRRADAGVLRRPDRPGRLADALRGRRIASVGRRAKLVLVDLAGPPGRTLVVHLKLTGKLWVAAADRPAGRHDRLGLTLDDGAALWLEDARRLAWVALEDATGLEARLAPLGPEPLDPGFTLAAWRPRLARRRGALLKAALLDPETVAGIGNIYADEVLHRARLHPMRRTGGLGPAELRRLHRAVRAVLAAAVGARSGTPRQERVAAGGRGAGERAAARLGLAAYGRAGEPCRRCRTSLVKSRVAGRRTYLCPRCQPRPPS